MPESHYSGLPALPPAQVAELRTQLSDVVASLVEAGVAMEVLMDDVRAGVARVAARHDRSGR